MVRDDYIVDDLAVVDHQGVPSTAPSPYHLMSHNSNFDPTPAPPPQANLPPREVAKLIPCRYFPQGTCKYGDSCIFSHGIPGVAGSPGVAPSPSVQAQLLRSSTQPADPQTVLHQQAQHFPSQQDEYLHGMPMYYPEQHIEQYGYSHHLHHHQHHQQQQQPFSPQGAFYPFPPPFFGAQHYQQAPPPPPQPFYHMPQAQQQAPQISNTALSSESRAFSPASTGYINASNPALASIAPQPLSTSPTTPASPSRDNLSAPSPPGTSPLLFAAASASQTDYAPAQSQSAAASMSPSSADHSIIPTLPNLLQSDILALNGWDGSASPSDPASAITPVNVTTSSNGKNAPRNGIIGPHGMPHFANVPRARGPMIGPAGGFDSVSNGKTARRNFPAGSPRPPCSFFEANRCRNRDACPFQHLLPDGSDARLLGQGWVGADGRTDNPEEKGGLPATWLTNPNRKKTGSNGAFFRNGAQSSGGPFYNGVLRQQRSRFEEEQARLRANTQAQVAAAGHNGVAGESPPGVPEVSSVLAANGSRLHPGGAAPQLVAAIHGLTRRIPPVQPRDIQAPHLPVAAPSGSKGPAVLTNGDRSKLSSALSRAAQRVPSGEDFPALTPGSPSPSFESSVAQPEVTAASQRSTSSAGVALEAPAEAQQIDDPGLDSAVVDSDFVMVNHSDAPASETAGTPSTEPSSSPLASAPVLGAAAMAAPSRLVGSFASAAARGAPVVLPEKSKKASSSFTPTLATAARGTAPDTAPAFKDWKDSSAPKKGGGPALKKHASLTMSNPATPFAVKA
ncbi:BQ5605_C011g06529 [Microbotryum silenes-dioicae]|uniref:BQ5605_C011g06529 protein n=1 Tax=Microbotryum silenes-dioicae TaxID=796604 RepID=A0A2X0NT81_9BASI|nr:BQ5605_C011g06529 [Microbotryum silenes-dioicae]